MLKKFKCFQWKSIILGFILLIGSQFIVSYIPIQTPPSSKMFVFSLLSTTLFFIFTNLKEKQALIKNCLLTVLFFGVTICITKPVQFGLDEESHLLNTIRVADSGIFIRENETINDYSTILNYDILRNPNSSRNVAEWRSEVHQESKFSGKITGISNLSYIPNALGWNLGKITSNKIFISYYLGRIFNILAFLLLLWVALKMSKYYKEVIYLLSTFPAILFICAGYHYDYLYFGLSLIVLSMLSNILHEKKPLTNKQIIAFQFTSFLFAFPKFPFILVGTLLLFLPKKYYVESKKRLFSIFSFLISFGLAGLYFLNKTIFKVLSNIPSTGSIEEKRTIAFFVKHPLPVIRTLLDSLPVTLESFANPLDYVFAGSKFLAALNTILFITLFLIVSRKIKIHLPNWFKFITMLLLLTISLLVIYAISGDSRVYKMGDILVGGVQGRYYYFMIGIIPLLVNPFLNRLFGHYNSDIVEPEISICFLQYSLAYLNVLTLGVALYTQIPH